MEKSRDVVVLDWTNMSDYTEDPIEYRFVDRVEVIPGVEAEGVKLASSQDWYYQVHFPGNPVMPGVFLMEAIMQTGVFIVTLLPGVKGKLMMFQSCKNVRIIRSVRPGDIIYTFAKLLLYKRGIATFEGGATVEGQLVCSMQFSLINPDDLRRYSPKV